MNLACVTFDLDDTLWHTEPVIVRAEAQFYGWLQQHCPRITERFDSQALVLHRRRYFQQFQEELHDLTTLRKRWLRHILTEFGYESLSVDEAFRVFWEHRNAVTLFGDVAEAIEELRARYTIGVITNGNACVEYIGIGHWFDFVVSSERAGAAKPNAEIFHAALDRAGVAPERVAHVGDDPENDVRGAAAVGMRTVWYNPRLRPWPGGPTPDVVIRSIAELPSAIAGW